MSKFEKARIFAIRSLQKALVAHGVDDVLSIGDGLEEYELLIPRDEIAANSLLYLTFEFWSAWSDSAIHGWYFYEPLGKNDWPRLAEGLLADLEANREVTSSEVVLRFSVTPRKSSRSIFSRVLEFFRGKAI